MQQITVYTKDYCPYCVQAKQLLKSLDINFLEEDITHNPDKIDELIQISGMRTVPQIFVGQTCLGGYSDIAKLHAEGKLLSAMQGN